MERAWQKSPHRVRKAAPVTSTEAEGAAKYGLRRHDRRAVALLAFIHLGGGPVAASCRQSHDRRPPMTRVTYTYCRRSRQASARHWKTRACSTRRNACQGNRTARGRAGHHQQRPGRSGLETRHAGHYDLVGDKMQEIFDAQVVVIGVFDRAAETVTFPYVDGGVPASPPTRDRRRASAGLSWRRARRSDDRDLARVAQELGSETVAGEEAKAVLFVPLTIGVQTSGSISLRNLDHEDAFSDSTSSLLTTLAASLSVALETWASSTTAAAAELAVVDDVPAGWPARSIRGDVRPRRRELRRIVDARSTSASSTRSRGSFLSLHRRAPPALPDDPRPPAADSVLDAAGWSSAEQGVAAAPTPRRASGHGAPASRSSPSPSSSTAPTAASLSSCRP